jgi:hypothetical protein
MISLNQLADEPYNAVFKLFATHRKEKQKAFQLLEQSRDISSILPGLTMRGTVPGNFKNLAILPQLIEETPVYSLAI